MADTNYDIHDATVSEVVVYSTTGAPQKILRSRYFVGDHGPFSDDFKPADAGSEQIKSKMLDRVALLRRVFNQPGV